MAKSKSKTATYCRVSGKGQIGGGGFPRQEQAVREYAAKHGLQIVAEYRDEGVSGTTEFDDREGLAELLDRLESNGIGTVLVERADRLARDLLVSELILDKFRKLGVRVIEAKSGTVLTDPDANADPTTVLVRQILGAIAEFDKSVTVAKLAAARKRIRDRDGRCEGRKPYGFHPAERDTLERIRQLRTKQRNRPRAGYGTVAAMLNSENRPTRTGKPWHPEVVRRIVRANWPGLDDVRAAC